MPDGVHGILLLDKPLGLSSAGAVARVKHLFGARKAGHTGSLDPLATGVLPVCFGEATKFGAQLLDADKTYRVTARLGERTPTADRESPVVETRELPEFTRPELERALADFPRRYSQIPPMHSALKQDGKPLYAYARAGIERERIPRLIAIHDLRMVAWTPPDLCFDVRCAKGAYIRVLAEDLAARLGSIAHLVGLRRLGVAPFQEADPWPLEALMRMSMAERLATLLPVDAALAHFRRLDVAVPGVSALRQGQPVFVGTGEPGTVRIYGAGLGFLGLGALQSAGELIPLRLIATGANPA